MLDSLENFDDHTSEVYENHGPYDTNVGPAEGLPEVDIVYKVGKHKHKVGRDEKSWLIEDLHSIKVWFLEWFDLYDEGDHQ